MKWLTPSIPYGFATQAPGYAWQMDIYDGFMPFSAVQADAARVAVSLWSDVIAIELIEAAAGAPFEIAFANSSTLPSASAGHAYNPGYSSWHGDVWINSTVAANTSPAIGTYGFHVLVHEIGHTLGLEHPGEYDVKTGPYSFAADAGSERDTWQYSVMSYFHETRSGADFKGSFVQTPMLDDITILQALYGANTTTRTGDTVYGFNTNTTAPVFDFDLNPSPVLSIWDAGGSDTIDASGFSQDAIIDLNAGAFSSLGGLTNNVSIAHGALIESAAGGSGHDLLIGNASDNWLNGGSGNDTAGISSAAGDANVYRLDTGQTIIHSSAGLDQLTDIETIAFDGANVLVASLPENSVLEYGASHADLILALGADEELLLDHLLHHGVAEGRDIGFSADAYLNAYEDLVSVFGTDLDAATRHYIEHGFFEGRTIEFV